MLRNQPTLTNLSLEQLNLEIERINKQIAQQKKSIETSNGGGMIPSYMSRDILKSYEKEKTEIEAQIAKLSGSSSIKQPEHETASHSQKSVTGLKILGAGLTMLGLFAGYKALTSSSATSTLNLIKSLHP